MNDKRELAETGWFPCYISERGGGVSGKDQMPEP